MQEQDMSALFDKLVKRTEEWAESNPRRPERFALSSDRVVSGTDEGGRVEATVADYAVATLRIDPALLRSGSAVEEAVTEAVNAALRAFLDAEFQDATAVAPEMPAVHTELLELSGEFHDAYQRAIDDLAGRMSA